MSTQAGGGHSFTSSGQQLLASFLTEIQSENSQDVSVVCCDGVVSLPRLLVASLSPCLATCLAGAAGGEQPALLLPHNTTHHIRTLVSCLVAGTEETIPPHFHTTFHWVDFTRPRNWTVAGITSGNAQASQHPAEQKPGGLEEKFSQFARRRRSHSSRGTARNGTKQHPSAQSSECASAVTPTTTSTGSNATLDIISRNIGLPIQLQLAVAADQPPPSPSPTIQCEDTADMAVSWLTEAACPPAKSEEERKETQEPAVPKVSSGSSSSSSQCSQCGKVLYDRHCLRRHEAAVHQGLRPHPCPHCSRGFAGRTDLAAHISSVHQRNKSFVCEVCGTALSSLKALQVHSLIHAGPDTKQQACPLCTKTFRHRNTLTKHVARVHQFDATSQLVCTVCSPHRLFRHLEGLRRHQRKLHSTQRDFPCEECGAAFAFNYDLSRHKRRAHPPHHQHAYREGETVYLCNPPGGAVVITEPFPLEGDIVQFTIEHPGVGERQIQQQQQEDEEEEMEEEAPARREVEGEEEDFGNYTQYQTVQIKGLSYNSILGQ